MARIVERKGDKWTTIARANEIHTYAGEHSENRFSIEIGKHRLELTADEAASLFARAFDYGAEKGLRADILATAKERAHKRLM